MGLEVVYKVLWERERGLWSGGIAKPGVAMRYKLNEVNYPTIPGSKLFAFQTLKQAKTWVIDKGFGSRVIYSAETPSVTVPDFMWDTYWLDLKDRFLAFWKSPSRCTYTSDDVPRGTVWCPSLKLLEKQIWYF